MIFDWTDTGTFMVPEEDAPRNYYGGGASIWSGLRSLFSGKANHADPMFEKTGVPIEIGVFGSSTHFPTDLGSAIDIGTDGIDDTDANLDWDSDTEDLALETGGTVSAYFRTAIEESKELPAGKTPKDEMKELSLKQIRSLLDTAIGVLATVDAQKRKATDNLKEKKADLKSAQSREAQKHLNQLTTEWNEAKREASEAEKFSLKAALAASDATGPRAASKAIVASQAAQRTKKLQEKIAPAEAAMNTFKTGVASKIAAEKKASEEARKAKERWILADKYVRLLKNQHKIKKDESDRNRKNAAARRAAKKQVKQKAERQLAKSNQKQARKKQQDDRREAREAAEKRANEDKRKNLNTKFNSVRRFVNAKKPPGTVQIIVSNTPSYSFYYNGKDTFATKPRGPITAYFLFGNFSTYINDVITADSKDENRLTRTGLPVPSAVSAFQPDHGFYSKEELAAFEAAQSVGTVYARTNSRRLQEWVQSPKPKCNATQKTKKFTTELLPRGDTVVPVYVGS